MRNGKKGEDKRTVRIRQSKDGEALYSKFGSGTPVADTIMQIYLEWNPLRKEIKQS